jgi:hypothetical protein
MFQLGLRDFPYSLYLVQDGEISVFWKGKSARQDRGFVEIHSLTYIFRLRRNRSLFVIALGKFQIGGLQGVIKKIKEIQRVKAEEGCYRLNVTVN